MSGLIEDEGRCKKLKDHVKQMEHTVKSLEDNLKDADHTNNQIIMSLKTDKIKYDGINSQLEEALKENQQLLNIIQQKSNEQDISRTNSQADVTRSCSTMSIVHLQYKYEELLANYHGLLKLLDLKSEEIKKVYDENIHLKSEIEDLKQTVADNNEKHSKLLIKFSKLKEKKNEKIEKLKKQKETLQMVHNQLVNVLQNQYMEKDSVISDEIRNCSFSDKALLLQEMKRNNMLVYENIQLNQEIEFLRSVVEVNKKQQSNKGQL